MWCTRGGSSHAVLSAGGRGGALTPRPQPEKSGEGREGYCAARWVGVGSNVGCWLNKRCMDKGSAREQAALQLLGPRMRRRMPTRAAPALPCEQH